MGMFSNAPDDKPSFGELFSLQNKVKELEDDNKKLRTALFDLINGCHGWTEDELKKKHSVLLN